MTSLARALWDAPAASPAPPRRVWRDWVLVGLIAPLTFVEAALRPEVPSRWLWAGLLLALSWTLLWRRTRPFTMLASAYAGGAIVGVQSGGDPELYVTAYFLVLLYAVARWGRGRSVIGGGVLVLVGWATTFLYSTPALSDAIGGLAVIALTFTVGFAFRWRAGARARQLERVRLHEREQLARDLHDTVAHHVSAIAIQAQAGAAVSETDPDAAARVLGVIEAEASRTLDEMRTMVGALRHGEAQTAPTPVIRDLEQFVHARSPESPEVRVAVLGNPDEVAPTSAATAFRIAQEAVTNARRHARGATLVDVTARIEAGEVALEVTDDGEAAASVIRTTETAHAGYGIAGMVERATLLGGSCVAGPRPDGGWMVRAVLPPAGGAAT